MLPLRISIFAHVQGLMISYWSSTQGKSVCSLQSQTDQTASITEAQSQPD